MCRLGGVAALDPLRYTLRELVEASEWRSQAEWAQVWAILAQLYNLSRGPDDPPMDPLKHCPHRDRRSTDARPPTEADRAELRKLFPGNKR